MLKSIICFLASEDINPFIICFLASEDINPFIICLLASEDINPFIAPAGKVSGQKDATTCIQSVLVL